MLGYFVRIGARRGCSGGATSWEGCYQLDEVEFKASRIPRW